MLNYFPLLILFAFGSPFISLMMSKATVKRAYNIRMIGESGARTEKEKLVIDTITLFSQKLGLQKLPEIGVYPSNDINAFATGASKNSAMVAVSQGLLNSMNETEIIGVLAHEMSHVLHRDILISTVVATFASAISMIANIAQWSLIFGGGRDDDDERGQPRRHPRNDLGGVQVLQQPLPQQLPDAGALAIDLPGELALGRLTRLLGIGGGGHVAAQLRDEDDGREHAAGTAPRRPEVQEYRALGIGDLALEVFFCNFNRSHFIPSQFRKARINSAPV